MTEAGGPAWRQTIYYPLYFASLYGRGDALNVVVDVPTYDAKIADDVPYLDALQSLDGAVHRVLHGQPAPGYAMSLDIDSRVFPKRRRACAIHHSDLKAINTAGTPNTVATGGQRAPGRGWQGEGHSAKSYNLVRVSSLMTPRSPRSPPARSVSRLDDMYQRLIDRPVRRMYRLSVSQRPRDGKRALTSASRRLAERSTRAEDTLRRRRRSVRRHSHAPSGQADIPAADSAGRFRRNGSTQSENNGNREDQMMKSILAKALVTAALLRSPPWRRRRKRSSGGTSSAAATASA